MNGFIEIIFLTLLLWLTFFVGEKAGFKFMGSAQLSLDNKSYVMQKIVIIFVVFFGYFILQLMGLPFQKDQPNLNDVIVRCLLTTLFAFIGITFYFDFMQMSKTATTKYNLALEIMSVIFAIISFGYFTNVGPRVDVYSALQAFGEGAFNIGKQVGTGIVSVGQQVGQQVGATATKVGETSIETGKQIIATGK
jgi:hypothetical protein